jgi:hypothetical protein
MFRKKSRTLINFIRKEIAMFTPSPRSPRWPRFRRLWKPAAVTGAGGTLMVIWLDEILVISKEILALIFLPLIAGVIYLFDIYVFKSRMPRREDMKSISDKGANQ